MFLLIMNTIFLIGFNFAIVNKVRATVKITKKMYIYIYHDAEKLQQGGKEKGRNPTYGIEIQIRLTLLSIMTNNQ